MTYEEAVQYIENAGVFGIQLGLGRIQSLLDRLGNPQNDYRTVHVTGTNGKGSVTAMIACTMYKAGIRTGRYTSPHLEDYTERIGIDGQNISHEDFAVAVTTVAAVVDNMAAEGMERPTEFEMLTAAAFWHFSRQHVEYAVIEVGLGGLFDSTNVIIPVLSVITNVALDHMKYCGDTIEKIAVHKAGIIKHGIPAVTAAREPALSVISSKACECGSSLAVLGREFDIVDRRCEGTAGQTFTVLREGMKELTVHIPLLGIHQSFNGAVAVMALTLLGAADHRITDSSIKSGIACVYWPGRFQVMHAGNDCVVIDGAHNPAGIASFCKTYQEIFGSRKRVFLFSVLADKDYRQMVRDLFHNDDYVVCAPAPSPRSSDPRQMAMLLPCRADWAGSVEEGLDKAFAAVQAGQILCILGSLYIQGAVRRYLRQRYGNTM